MPNRALSPRFGTTPIIIAGAGIAGLATALALARDGHTLTVLEKRSDAAEDGAGIQIGPNGMRILQALGVTPFLDGRIAWPDSIRVMDGVAGHILTAFPLGADIANRLGAPYGVLHRADLHNALRAACEKHSEVTFRYGAQVTTATSHDEGVIVRLSDGNTIAGEVLIGADGLWSTLRSTVMGAAPLTFTGKCAMRAVIPMSDVPDAISTKDTTIWLRPAAHVVHYPVRGGTELAIVAIFDDPALGETWSQSVDPSVVASRARSFPPALRNLLLQPKNWRQWSLYTPAAPFAWVKDRVALIGDAAHPPLPFLAQGGAMALEDAVVLSALLQCGAMADVPAYLREFERLRRPRTTRVMDKSSSNGRAYHHGGVMRLARNAVLAATPPQLFMRQYDWLYGWRPDDILKSARTRA